MPQERILLILSLTSVLLVGLFWTCYGVFWVIRELCRNFWRNP